MELIKSLFLVTAVGILLGAGLPTLFSLSIHFLSPTEDGTPVSGGKKAIAWIFMALVLIAVVAALLLIARERIEYISGWDPYPFL
ncbi:hypothetical protein [Corynebacterium gottingense]|uniref:Uncharacterized protein n=1 Tax=Corynebacterium gottingense TaxID=2041036 RepID=A0ABX9UIY0_9CORY|nr:hypothetical protein [Corynebacterium gottingense]RMD19016.1 hypothetical protein EAW56_07700 [Corynebacterium gottingense]WJZ14252.1 hypothetical protein CGOTT_11815 [Corynebacterium gottingense]WJZ16565.1 hypothetical protein CGOTTB_11755 [Corynebacterium gottingense]